MKIVQIFLTFIIYVKILRCETATTSNVLLANRKQQKLIEGSIDWKVNPCDDFYEYACGNWDVLHKEAGKNYYEAVGLLDYNVNKEMARVFSRIKLRNKPKFVGKAYQFYMSCKDVEKYQPLQYLKWMKENENIKFPTLWTPSTKPVEFDWLNTLAIMRIYGMNGIFIEETVLQRSEDALKFIIDLDKPVADGGFTALTHADLKLLIESLGISMSARSFVELWHEIQEFELELTQLDAIEDDAESDQNDENDSRLITFNDLPLSWLKDYLKILLNQTELSPNMEIYLQNIPYLKALDDLVKKHTPRFLCKYLEIRFLWHLFQQGPSNFIEEDCLSTVRTFLPTAMHWLYEYQHPHLRQEFPKIIELYEDIRKHFNKTIQQNEHGFNATVVDYLLAKINNMQLKLNNIPRIDTIQSIENFYNNLDLNIDEFYANHLKVMKFNFMASHNLLNNTTQQEYFYLEGTDSGASSSPYFIQRSNTVVIPLTLLQQPIYQPDSDKIYKYSSLGFLLAHEIIHGFDNTGLEIDHNGVMVSKSYNDIIANPLFNASFNCLLEMNPSVIDEKIADISGLRYSYQMFNASYPDARTKTTKIYGMDLPLSQIFFLNFAQFFCGTQFSDEFITTTSHGSDRERVMDALTHFPEFSNVFQCNSSNRMYPREECHIWR